MICHNLNLTFITRNLCSLETNISDRTLKSISLRNDCITDAKLILGNDSNSSNKILNHILESQTDYGSQNPQPSEQRCNVNTEN